MLYKYASLRDDRLDWIERLLVHSELYCASRRDFNDPLDCLVTLDFTATALKREQHWKAAARRTYPGMPANELRRHVRRMTRRPQAELQDLASRSLDQVGMLCLTEQPENQLMWSYYADGHRGIALRFRKCAQMVGLPTWFPVKVKYEEKVPSLNYYKSDYFELAQGLAGTKSTAWTHEQEWRLVLVNSCGKVTIPPEMIDGVILGLRTGKDREERIRQWIKERNAPTELLRVISEKDSFLLKIVRA